MTDIDWNAELDSKWGGWYDKCPKCGSTNIKKLNEIKGHFRKGNPLGLRNKQKYVCNECKHEFWVKI